MTGPNSAGPLAPGPYPADPAMSGPHPSAAGPHGYPSGPHPSGPHPSGPYPSGAYPNVGYPSGPYPTGPHPSPYPSGPYPAAPAQYAGGQPGSGPFPVDPAMSGPAPAGSAHGANPAANPGSGPEGGWSYGLPSGPRPDLLRRPIGQAGALQGASWEQNALRGASYPSLVWAELRKLVATFSDRVVMMLAPIWLVGVFVLAADVIPPSNGSVAEQALALIPAASYGAMFLHLAILKTFTGEWHYRSIQLSLLLQSSRRKYLLAQYGAMAVLWLVMTVVDFAIYLPLRGMAVDPATFTYFLSDRALWLLGATALAAAITMVWCMVIATLIPHPTAAIVVYFLLSNVVAFVGLIQSPIAAWLSPYSLPLLYIGKFDSPLAAGASTAFLFSLLALGTILVSQRDAR